MFEGLIGRLVSGAVWGAGAGLVLSVARGGTGLRPVTRALMQAYVVTSEKVREATAEARESLEDIYHEAQTERRNGHAGMSVPSPSTARRGTTRSSSSTVAGGTGSGGRSAALARSPRAAATGTRRRTRRPSASSTAGETATAPGSAAPSTEASSTQAP